MGCRIPASVHKLRPLGLVTFLLVVAGTEGYVDHMITGEIVYDKLPNAGVSERAWASSMTEIDP